MWNGNDLASRGFLSYVRAFPPIRGKLRVARAMANVMDTLSIVGENGARFGLDPSDWISWIIASEGAYERQSLRLASNLLAPGGTLLDVGAAWGLYTCSLGVLPGVTVVAVEPTPASSTRLQENIARNSSVRASVYSVALGESPGILPMGLAVEGNRLTMSAVTCASIAHHAAMVTPTMLIDAAAIERIRLMKIDVEGYEMRIFRAWPWDRIRPDHILAEFNLPAIRAAGETIEGTIAFFESRGYTVRCVDGSRYRAGMNIPEDNLLLSTAS